MSSQIKPPTVNLQGPRTFRKLLKRWSISDNFSIAKVVNLAGITDFRLETNLADSLVHGISIPRNGLLAALNGSCAIFNQWDGSESFSVTDRGRIYSQCLQLISPLMLELNLDPAGSSDFSRPWQMITNTELRLLLPPSPDVRNLIVKHLDSYSAPKFYVTTPRPRSFTWNKPLLPAFIEAHNHISSWHRLDDIDSKKPFYDYLKWLTPHAQRLSFMGFDCW